MSISSPIPLSDGPPGWTRFFHADEPSEPAPLRRPAAGSQDGVLSPGKVFAEQWEVRKELGAGGMARVYKVSSLLVRRDYAMKVLDQALAKDAMAVARFKHEFCTLKRLSHPHIVKADTFVAARGEEPCLYTMEFLEGEPLDKIAKKGPLPVERAVQITLQICDAIVALHHLGVLHRDIKPANIIVGEIDGKDHATLVDLGVCKWTPRYYAELDDRTPPDLRRETRAGTVLGTPGYMGASEEDSDGEFRDVFGLGATLFRLVTGRMPYKGEPGPDAVVGWSSADPDFPESLTEALNGALAASVGERFQSMTEFRDALELVVDQLALEAGKVGRPEPDTTDVILPPTHRPPWRSLFFGVGLGIGLGIGAGIGISLGFGSNDPTGDVASEESERAPLEADVQSPAHSLGDELRLNNAASCVPPNSGDESFVDLEINAEGYLAGINPSAGVDPLTVACLKRKLGRAPLSSGGQSTHRILLTSILRGELEHDDD